MPEGDTVWLAGRRLNDALAGQRLTSTDFRVPQLATTDLSGSVVSEVVSRGKHLLTRLDDNLTLHTHFRMDGTWHLYRPGVRWHGGPDWQVRVVLATDPWRAVGYRLPVVELIARADEHRVVGHLGPDLLGDEWDLDEALSRLRAGPDRPIGEALIDQRNLAGIGNLYKAESLFVSRLSPWCPVRDVPDLAAVVEQARRLLTINRLHPAQVTTGVSRRGEEHWVFERAGKPCRRCRTVVQVAKQGVTPFDRLTYWCPTCQKPSARPHPR